MENEGDGWFTTTHWSVVLLAADPACPEAHEALERLCRTYWYPVYAFVRRQKYSPEDAEDLTQGFFADLLRRQTLVRVAPQKGKFRTWVLVCLRNFLSDARARAGAIKRGRGQEAISFDGQSPETRYRLEPVDHVTPETLFDRNWALTILEKAREALRVEWAASEKASSFEPLLPALFGDRSDHSYAELAQRLGLSESAIKSRVSRMRERYGELVRLELAQTVTDRAEVDEELRYLVAALRG